VDLKKKFPKGQVIVHIEYGFPGIVTKSPRGKNSTVMEVEAFGAAHEVGDSYIVNWEPCSLWTFRVMGARWKGEKRYYRGKLIGR
jgi:hypothetical protein